MIYEGSLVYAGGVHHYVHAKDLINVDSKNDVEFENKLDKKTSKLYSSIYKSPSAGLP